MAGARSAYLCSARREVRGRVVRDYLPIWLEWKPDADVSRIHAEDWSFLPPAACRWFLDALDAGVVTISQHRLLGFTVAGGGCIHPFGDQDTKLYREVFFTVAAAGMLALEFGWPNERLRFEPKRAAGKPTGLHWAFDLVAYADDGRRRVALACETKKSGAEAKSLLADVQQCCARGRHPDHGSGREQNHHRKYRGLVEHRPSHFWIIEPGTFSDSPDLLFGVEVLDGDRVDLQRVLDPRTFTPTEPGPPA